MSEPKRTWIGFRGGPLDRKVLVIGEDDQEYVYEEFTDGMNMAPSEYVYRKQSFGHTDLMIHQGEKDGSS